MKKVQDGKKTVKRDGVKTSVTCKKLFVLLLDNAYTFRKKKTRGKRELGNFRAQFVCTECDKMNVFLSAYCSVHVLDFDVEELDEYQVQSLPDHDKHACQPSGILIGRDILIVPSKGKKSANNPYCYLFID